ncbi:30S ribosomal protein S9 [Candidatus Gromoviella agglomerans]|uniref:30S ribosomal protein S9 n=1 Tax=Candidatus Gromoviella agglomerans TaxID=2806609 RepID=UPI001E46B813|nr:30S ribosomal protein S9 [Candidatus Gromoviella agglomerans]UFX98592.1 30S ribosomal protein S9 [Candidatus Gromoviella agglomerans]
MDKYGVPGKFYSTGKRKDAVARVWICSGTGKFSVNSRDLNSYFPSRSVFSVLEPFKRLHLDGKIDVFCTVKGGGFTGQSGAIRHGIGRALAYYDPALKHDLRVNGFLTRDSRVVEPKKYGRHKARKATQFSKR